MIEELSEICNEALEVNKDRSHDQLGEKCILFKYKPLALDDTVNYLSGLVLCKVTRNILP